MNYPTPKSMRTAQTGLGGLLKKCHDVGFKTLKKSKEGYIEGLERGKGMGTCEEGYVGEMM